MLKVGITGGIGSGKSTVCRFFQALGVPVYNADDRAKFLMNTDAALIARIQTLLGPDAYRDGQLDRAYIAEKVFKDKSLLGQLNAIVHPAVFLDSIAFFEKHKDDPYVLYEAAILFESGNYKAMDKVILVYAPEELRIRRTMERDGLSREAVLERMRQQMPEAEKRKLADLIIENDGSQTLSEQVLTIHRQLIGKN